MSKYNEQHATTMLNALQGTETLERFKQEIRAEVIEECIKLQLDMSCVEDCIHMVDCTECMAEKMEQLKEQK